MSCPAFYLASALRQWDNGMVIAALLLVTAAQATMTATPVRATATKLRLSPSVVAGQIAAESVPHRRSRYLLPRTDSPTADADGIRFRWKLNKVKMTMPIPSI
ncbi:hypothetical protein HL653_09955 [Sphingomonas sp. AP4-R1]|uniref:hypothetical protein n=1 Tax=Sphingomonas sp. AP4-R1 TaxID=2735134 RepID=UPI001493ABD2|nr:hypothetical protein [Sphingomonas sp. AP4-R1]QJU58082.1 hypothetical protein HL653_09955 [Sphingomonas sp. AP4-R1]